MPLSSLRFHQGSFTVFLAIFLAPTSSYQVPSSIKKFLVIISENNFFFSFIFPYLLCGSQYVEGLRLLKSRYLKQLTQFNKYSNQLVFSFPFRYSYPLNSLFIISTFNSFLWIVNIFNYRREFAEANEFLKKLIQNFQGNLFHRKPTGGFSWISRVRFSDKMKKLSCQFCKTFKNTFFAKHFRESASRYCLAFLLAS